MSITAGLHAPLTPLSELAGKAGTEAPAQMVRAIPMLNTGVVFGVIVTVKVVVVAHWPAAGVNV